MQIVGLIGVLAYIAAMGGGISLVTRRRYTSWGEWWRG